MLKEVRILKKMSQRELAEKSGVSKRMIQHYEQGVKDIKKAAAETVKKLADALSCDVADIINDDIDFKNAVKLEDALSKSNIHQGNSTVTAILEQIPVSLFNKLDADELSLLLDAVDKAYKKGRASTGAEMIDKDTVWINSLQKEIKITP